MQGETPGHSWRVSPHASTHLHRSISPHAHLLCSISLQTRLHLCTVNPHTPNHYPCALPHRVPVALDLSYLSLSTALPGSLSLSTQLTSLSMQGNAFTGALPESFSQLTKLQASTAIFTACRDACCC